MTAIAKKATAPDSSILLRATAQPRSISAQELPVNTESQYSAQLSQLRSAMQRMSVATLSNIDEHGALRSYSMPRWEMDDCGALWFFTNQFGAEPEHLQGINLSVTNVARTRHITLSGRVELYVDNLGPEYLLGAFWQGLSSPRIDPQAQQGKQLLLKFIPQSAIYWHAPQSLLTRLFALFTRVFSGKPVPLKPGVRAFAWELDVPRPAK